ncbi:MAG TPA: Crp/Fnr family transcriptional regulator [Candidatus Polarisedimenticolaceae bacterium]|nr:Crp/Fnr family transcriptional regulator [Candidatus Polarisedimenticolaceae bacterium]
MPKSRPSAEKLRVLKPPTCFECQMHPRTAWASVADEDRDLLDRAKTCNVYDPGQVIFYEGNACLGIHCIESGNVKLSKRSQGGDDVVVSLAEPGDVLGYLAYFADGGHTTTAEAVSACRVCFVDRAAVKTLIQRNPALGLAFLKKISGEAERSEDERVRALSLPLRARAAHLLLVLKDRSATADEQGRLTIDLPLSRRDLAAMLGARPESLSRLIKAFETEGIARFGTREVMVPDLDVLMDQLGTPAEA